MKTLKNTIDRAFLRRMAGSRSYSRGQDYFEDEQVDDLAEYQGVITAKVQGTRSYKVKLWLKGEDFEHFCSCPMGDEGDFCKHCVAVGLAWLEGGTVGQGKLVKDSKPAVTLDDVKKWLERQEKTTLVEMLFKQALEDDGLRRDLLLKAAKTDSKKGINVDAYRSAIKSAVNDRDDFVDYGSGYGYAQGIEGAVDGIDGLLSEGYAEEVIGLAEYAIRQVESALNSVDDSAGYMGDLLSRLQAIHLGACKKAKPDSEALAKRLFDWEIHTDWDTFHGAAETYGQILGKKGLAVYRQLAEAEWVKVPALTAGREGSWEGRRYRITHMMEALARQSGDVEELVAVMARDLSSAYAYFKIAEIYKGAGKSDLALDWAEKGLKNFPERTDSRLREFVVQEYFRRKRYDEAMALVWLSFSDSARLEQYKKLKEYADRISQWPVWREKAIALIREEFAGLKSRSSRNSYIGGMRSDPSSLVEILIWEKDVEGAWREAKASGCSNQLWLELARKREHDHPADALTIYQGQIEPTLALKNNGAYQEAIRFLRKIKELMERSGQREYFKTYVGLLGVTHKPKRNFIKLLDALKV